MNRTVQLGFSIIELMIALLLGTILLLGVTQVMISSSTLGTTSKNLLVNQETANTVFDILSGVRRAGYKGCQKGGLIMPKTNPPSETDEDAYGIVYPIFPRVGDIGLSVRYGDVANGTADPKATLIDSKDCLNNTLYYREYTYKNCDNALCITATGNRDEAEGKKEYANTTKINNVTIDKIVFTVIKYDVDTKKDSFYEISIGGDNPSYTGEYPTSPTRSDLDMLMDARTVTFYITVVTNEPNGKDKSMVSITRSYSATYDLRNL